MTAKTIEDADPKPFDSHEDEKITSGIYFRASKSHLQSNNCTECFLWTIHKVQTTSITFEPLDFFI